MVFDMHTASELTVWSVGGLGSLIALIRYYTKNKNANKSESIQVEVSNALLISMQNEIKRLEEIIRSLNTKVERLESNINALRELEIHAAADFGALEVIVSSLPCAECVNRGIALEQLKKVMERMSERRKERHIIINEEAVSV